MGDSVEHGLIVRQGDLGELFENGLEFAETLGGNVETDRVVDAAKLLEESLTNKADADNADKSLAPVLGNVLIGKGAGRLLEKHVN